MYDYDVESRTHDGLVLAQINSYIVNKAKHTPKDQMLNGRRIGDGYYNKKMMNDLSKRGFAYSSL